MASSAKSRISQGTTLHSHSTNRFCSSSVSNFVTRPAPVHPRSTSPTRISLGRSVSSAVRFSTSDHRQHNQNSNARPITSSPKKTCSCSPSTHPGSFRCSLHRNSPVPGHVNAQAASYRSSNRQLHMRRSAMTNSLVRIGTVEGDLVKRALASLIRPSSHTQRRRENFQPRPSRLSVMSVAEES
ncbi:hypothetical protein F511_22519 [Dorcoceras hygrometricum]|uniref:Serine-rich protein-like protein n=1 Tax=Dorcoceras hygrometricum TaxID=472368 RepID=A0A2Z7CE84_9LAMI|nr:hypothetical protein F511_22519 [Dorcoceras hygrometricum]